MRKVWTLTILTGLAGMLYVYLFTDWLSPRRIQIIPQFRPSLGGAARRALGPVSFVLNGSYRLTHIRVIPLPDPAPSRPAPPTWELATSSNSVPVRGFLYGQKIRGMKPPATASADPLEPGTAYRMIVEAGRAKGEVEFQTPPAVPF